MNFVFANAGVNAQGAFTRYEIVFLNAEQKPSDYILKKKVVKFLTESFPGKQVSRIEKPYNYPGFRSRLSNGHIVNFTIIRRLTE
jgi:hypothetical protein